MTESIEGRGPVEGRREAASTIHEMGEGVETPPSPVEPEGPVERQLVEMCEALLGRTPVGVTEDLVGSGTDSKLARRFLAEIEERFGRKLSMDVLLRERTIRNLANVLRSTIGAEARSPLVPIQPDGARLPFFAVPPSASPEIVFGHLARHLGMDQPFFGLKPPVPDGPRAPTDWFARTAAHYIEAIREIQPAGPYHLGGRCFGAFVAFEMAQQLTRQGEHVALLALLDASAPLTRTLRYRLRRLRIGTAFRLRNFRRALRGQSPIEYALIPNHGIRFDLVNGAKRETANYDKLVWDANLRGAAVYETRPYEGKITLIQSRRFDRPGLGRAWERLARGGLDFQTVAAGHVNMLREPDVRGLAATLAACLDATHEVPRDQELGDRRSRATRPGSRKPATTGG